MARPASCSARGSTTSAKAERCRCSAGPGWPAHRPQLRREQPVLPLVRLLARARRRGTSPWRSGTLRQGIAAQQANGYGEPCLLPCSVHLASLVCSTKLFHELWGNTNVGYAVPSACTLRGAKPLTERCRNAATSIEVASARRLGRWRRQQQPRLINLTHDHGADMLSARAEGGHISLSGRPFDRPRAEQRGGTCIIGFGIRVTPRHRLAHAPAPSGSAVGCLF